MSSFDKELECPLCLGFLESTHILQCCHRFCGSCIQEAIQAGHKNCPMCQVRIMKKYVRPDPLMDNLVSLFKKQAEELEDKKANLMKMQKELDEFTQSSTSKIQTLEESLKEASSAAQHSKSRFIQSQKVLNEKEDFIKKLQNDVDEKQNLLDSSIKEKDSVLLQLEAAQKQVLEIQSEYKKSKHQVTEWRSKADKKQELLCAQKKSNQEQVDILNTTLQDMKKSSNDVISQLKEKLVEKQNAIDTLTINVKDMEEAKCEIEKELSIINSSYNSLLQESEIKTKESCSTIEDLKMQLVQMKKIHHSKLMELSKSHSKDIKSHEDSIKALKSNLANVKESKSLLVKSLADLEQELETSKNIITDLKANEGVLIKEMERDLQKRIELLSAENLKLNSGVDESKNDMKEAMSITLCKENNRGNQQRSLRRSPRRSRGATTSDEENNENTKEEQPVQQRLVEPSDLKQESKYQKKRKRNSNENSSKRKKKTHSRNTFEQYLTDLREFKKKQGHCNVPCVYENDPSLGNWVRSIRYSYKQIQLGKKPPRSLTKANIEKLDKIGFQWQLSQILPFDLQMTRMMESDESSSAIDDYSVDDDASIGAEFDDSENEIERPTNSRQGAKRENYALDTGHHKGKKVLSFDERLNDVKEFKRKHGHCNVPYAYNARNNFGQWVGRVRAMKRGSRVNSGVYKLTNERIKKLEIIGFRWIATQTFEDRFNALKQFKRKHGHCNVPRADDNLGDWVSIIRSMKKGSRVNSGVYKLNNERIKKLENIGFR